MNIVSSFYRQVVENILLLRIMILHDISYSHTDLKLLICSNLIKPQGRKEKKCVLQNMF